MHGPVAVVALLFLVVVAAQSYVNLGEACYYDEECDTVTTFCRDRRVCACKELFREAEGRCVAMVGARCSADYECSSLEYSTCDERRCICRDGYVRDESDRSCLSVQHQYEGACELDTQCQEGLGDQAYCQNSMCVCWDGRHYADGACWHSKGLGESCFNTSECSYDQDQRHRVHCEQGHCQCKGEYRRNDRVCDDGASQIALSMMAVFFLLVVRFAIG